MQQPRAFRHVTSPTEPEGAAIQGSPKTIQLYLLYMIHWEDAPHNSGFWFRIAKLTA